MFEKLIPPTDSLYKLLFIFSVCVCVFAFSGLYKCLDIKEGLLKLGTEREQAAIEFTKNEANNKAISSKTEMMTILRKTSNGFRAAGNSLEASKAEDLMWQFLRESFVLESENVTRKIEFDKQNARIDADELVAAEMLNNHLIISLLLLLFGSGATVVFYFQWKDKLQDYEDIKQKLGAEHLHVLLLSEKKKLRQN